MKKSKNQQIVSLISEISNQENLLDKDKKEHFLEHDDINNEIFTSSNLSLKGRIQLISWDFTTGVLLHSITLQQVINDRKVVCDNDLTNKRII